MQVRERLQQLPHSDFEWEVKLKPLPSAEDKAEYKGSTDLLELADLVRGRVFFSQALTYEDVIAQLSAPEYLGRWLKDVDDKCSRKEGFEYCGLRHLDLCVDGVKFELQLLPIEYKPFVSLLHRVYELHRNGKMQLSSDKLPRAKELHNRMYELLDQLYHLNHLSH